MNRSVFDNWDLDNFVGVISVGTVSVGISVISSAESGSRKGVVSVGISLVNCSGRVSGISCGDWVSSISCGGRVSSISFHGRVSSINSRISISDRVGGGRSTVIVHVLSFSLCFGLWFSLGLTFAKMAKGR